MTPIKEKLIGAITIMTDGDVQELWEMVQNDYVVRRKTWNDIEEVEPTEEEVELLDAYENGDKDYQPVMSHSNLLKHLNL